jgi:hypothetical protein
VRPFGALGALWAVAMAHADIPSLSVCQNARRLHGVNTGLDTAVGVRDDRRKVMGDWFDRTTERGSVTYTVSATHAGDAHFYIDNEGREVDVVNDSSGTVSVTVIQSDGSQSTTAVGPGERFTELPTTVITAADAYDWTTKTVSSDGSRATYDVDPDHTEPGQLTVGSAGRDVQVNNHSSAPVDVTVVQPDGSTNEAIVPAGSTYIVGGSGFSWVTVSDGDDGAKVYDINSESKGGSLNVDSGGHDVVINNPSDSPVDATIVQPDGSTSAVTVEPGGNYVELGSDTGFVGASTVVDEGEKDAAATDQGSGSDTQDQGEAYDPESDPSQQGYEDQTGGDEAYYGGGDEGDSGDQGAGGDEGGGDSSGGDDGGGDSSGGEGGGDG